MSREDNRPEPVTRFGIPYCSVECWAHDGKRCELLGFAPSTLCEPAVGAIVNWSEINDAQARLWKERAKRLEDALRSCADAMAPLIQASEDRYIPTWGSTMDARAARDQAHVVLKERK